MCSLQGCGLNEGRNKCPTEHLLSPQEGTMEAPGSLVILGAVGDREGERSNITDVCRERVNAGVTWEYMWLGTGGLPVIAPRKVT